MSGEFLFQSLTESHVFVWPDTKLLILNYTFVYYRPSRILQMGRESWRDCH